MFARTRILLTAAALTLFVTPGAARAQSHEHRAGMHATPDSTAGASSRLATLPGQDAFGAIAEVVAILRADSTTNWSKVSIEALRQHLIDMNAVTLRSDVVSTNVPDGVQLRVTGDARVRDAAHRMLTAHSQALIGEGLNATVTDEGPALLWTVTSAGGARTAELRALGLAGILTIGNHHSAHHLQLARGETPAGHSH